jgi:sarcinarray family protein
MKRTWAVLCLGILFFITNIVTIVTAGECQYGSAHAWFRTPDGEWQNATFHPQLKRGQEYEIRITVTTKTTLQVFFLKLHEFGTPVFEVLDGPMMMEQIFENRQTIPSNQTFTYLWHMRVKPETSWVNGYAPLEIFAQFNVNDADECRIGFDVITASIVDELWQDDAQTTQNKDQSSPDISRNDLSGFEITAMLIVVFLCNRMKKRVFIR